MNEFHMAPTNAGPGANAVRIIYIVLRVAKYESAMGLGLFYDSFDRILSKFQRLEQIVLEVKQPTSEAFSEWVRPATRAIDRLHIRSCAEAYSIAQDAKNGMIQAAEPPGIVSPL